MEQWEIDYRKILNFELPDGIYQLGIDELVVKTGKKGYINYLVEIKRNEIAILKQYDIVDKLWKKFNEHKNKDGE
jgi:hypothetical protein